MCCVDKYTQITPNNMCSNIYQYCRIVAADIISVSDWSSDGYVLILINDKSCNTMAACPPNKVWRSLVSKIKTMLRSAAQCLVVVVVLRLVFTSVFKTREQLVVIPQATPREVWEFMADFSNYKLLNPHLIQWHVLSDSAHKKKQVDISYF